MLAMLPDSNPIMTGGNASMAALAVRDSPRKR